MIFGEGIFGVASVILWVYCIFDVIAAEESLIRNMQSKPLWLFIVILIPDVGSIAWLLLGRPAGLSLLPGETRYRGPRRRDGYGPRPMGPEDSPGFERRFRKDDEPGA